MRHYLRIVLNFLFIAASIGFIVPWLVSAPSDFAALAGMLYFLVVMPIVLWFFNRKYIMTLVEKLYD